MFTSKKIIVAATVAAQFVLASDLLWFEEDPVEDPLDAMLEEDDADLTQAEIEDERRMLAAKPVTDPAKEGYFRGRNSSYKTATKEAKMEALWSQLVPDENDFSTTPAPNMYLKHPDFFTQKAQSSFCNNSDELRNKRFKTTHTQGLVAKVEWVPTAESREEGYTGMMNTGSDHIIMRLSETQNFDENQEIGLLPSMAMKFLRDNDMSYNMFGMPSFYPTSSFNFFEFELSNVVEPLDQVDNQCEIQTLLKKMVEANQRPFGTAISDIARCNHDGTTVENVKVPYRLHFISPISFSSEKEYTENADGSRRLVMWYEQLQRIPKDSTIYEVYAFTAPESLGGDYVKIADIKLRSNLYTSEFGDNRLFFRHQSISKDRKFWPRSWRRLNEDPFISKKIPDNIWGNQVPDTWPKTEAEAKQMYDMMVEEFNCPFKWLMPGGIPEDEDRSGGDRSGDDGSGEDRSEEDRSGEEEGSGEDGSGEEGSGEDE